MVNYELIKTTIDSANLAEIIFNIGIEHYSIFNQLLVTKAHFSSQSSDLCYATFLVSSKSSLLYSIYN